jgi:hypothetical protein
VRTLLVRPSPAAAPTVLVTEQFVALNTMTVLRVTAEQDPAGHVFAVLELRPPAEPGPRERPGPALRVEVQLHRLREIAAALERVAHTVGLRR